ncbi:hypoxanthine-guanine phosphoribosyltransferase [Williamsoniiplasma luminosum]|uniref:Hypoxanthine phosphoribosyltransferase n=1 Tax=Williamsoniiplasma luminosum TaxID=214888 RepID=A0A2K8NUM9_9MOLU|nr:hypoxanthine phosphoribosyltransferase [Williamsoniiplasma luminosum]ATZ17552.1 hypoxanthine-guanine phosphoribosyltransferase [Williamsoniiplasma luminosum]
MQHPLVKKILHTREEISLRSQAMALDVDAYYKQQKVQDNTVLVVGILKGCVPFMSELLNHVKSECEIDYMVMSSYKGGVKANANPEIVLDISTNLKGRHVLLVEDIIDSGLTLDFVKKDFYHRGAADVKIITMIDKPANRQAKITADWFGFEVEDEFLIGFGLDYEERLRNLPYVAICDTSKLKTWKW